MENLTGQQLEAIRLLCETTLNNIEIAEEIGVHRNTIGNWRKDKAFMAAQREYVQDSFGNLAGEALQNILKIMRTSENEKMVLDSARDILDRAGYKATDKLDIKTTPSIHVTWEE